ncbi:MAG: flagellar hook-associated protein FlgK [Paracoccaceae bacterium]
MSLSATMNSAMSGLTAARRAALTVSDNIANALTPGYSTRTVELTGNRNHLPGVQVVGITRGADPALVSERRSAEATHAGDTTRVEFHNKLSSLLGDPTQPGSLASRATAIEAALIEAASAPHSDQRLDQIAHRMNDLVNGLQNATKGIQVSRQKADASIAQSVRTLNTSLKGIEELNARISNATPKSTQVAALQDQRALLIDEVNSLVPVKVVSRSRGQIALFTGGGAILLDGAAAKLEFNRTPIIEPHMTWQNGLLSGLAINGRPVNLDSDANPISGGRLMSMFDVRDTLAPEAQSGLDAIAADFAERFQDPTADLTRGPTLPGFLTDRGAVFDSSNITGFAGRIALNVLIDPQEVGETWRLRAGIGASDPGDPGTTLLLNRLSGILSNDQAVSHGPVTGSSGRFGTLISQTVSHFSVEHSAAERSLSFSNGILTETRRAEHAQGVDTDEQMQTLLLVEQAYAANAQMLRTAEQLMDILLEI